MDKSKISDFQIHANDEVCDMHSNCYATKYKLSPILFRQGLNFDILFFFE